jgi:hypothetical protein
LRLAEACAGNGVILSSTDDSYQGPCTPSIDWVKEHVTFMDWKAARRWCPLRFFLR